jgi:hypothetical protein
MTNRQRLEEAARNGDLIRFHRRFEDNRVCGYVLDVGPKFFLLAHVCDRIRFDGFECLRASDVRRIELPTPAMRNFVETTLRKRREQIRKKPRIDLASVESILKSASRIFPLVTIHRENADPDVCWVGRVRRMDRGRVSLLEINPDATWDEEVTEHRAAGITRIDFDGDYEKALYLVGGEPPKEPRR